MKLISVNLPENYLKVLEVLVAEGKFPNRSEAIRVGIRDLIKTEFLIDENVRESFDSPLEKPEPIDIEEELLV